MLFFSKDLNRTLSRSKALKYKSLVVADDIEAGNEVDVNFSADNVINITKADREIPDFEQVMSGKVKAPDYILLVKEFAVFKNISNELQILICDDYMLVELIRGCIVVELDGRPMIITRDYNDRNGNPLKIPNCNIDTDCIWLSGSDIAGYVQHWHKDKCKAKYTQDYLYSVCIEGSTYMDRSSRPLTDLTIRKGKEDGNYIDPLDLSGGMVDFIAEREHAMERTRSVARSMNLSSVTKGTAPTSGYPNDAFEDFGSDDEDANSDLNDYDDDDDGWD